jgi:hypothetical protein
MVRIINININTNTKNIKRILNIYYGRIKHQQYIKS